jgi:hypothetical protein
MSFQCTISGYIYEKKKMEAKFYLHGDEHSKSSTTNRSFLRNETIE